MNRLRGFEKISFNQFSKDWIGDNDTKLIIDRHNEIILPKRATAKSAGYDCYSLFSFELQPNEEIKLPTGIKAYMQDDEVLKVYPRSGLGFKYYTRLANTVGIIDADYYNNADNEGHIWIKLRNEGNKTLHIDKGDAICQVIFQNYLLADGDNFSGNKRNGGFGSTNL